MWPGLLKWTLLSCLLCSMCRFNAAGITQGHYRGSETWVYVDRFVFTPREGSSRNFIELELDFPATTLSPAIMLYFLGDQNSGLQREFGLWERAYNTDLVCEERALIAQQEGGKYISLEYIPKTRYFDEKNEARWNTTYRTTITTSRARWLFIAIGNCKPNCGEKFCASSLDVRYRVNLTNGSGAARYFSGDEQWFWELSISILVVYILLFMFTLYTRHLLLQKKKYHPSVSLLFWCILMSTIGSFIETIYFSRYASEGFAPENLKVAALVLKLVAEFYLLLTIILVAKGWTILRRKISAMGRVRLASYMTLYVVISISCWVYNYRFSDPAVIVYVYSTAPGILLVLLRTFAFIWFSYAINVTLRKYGQKRGFYKKFWLLAGAWILTMPVLVLINEMVDFWFRNKLIRLVDKSSTFICQAVLIILYNPHTLGKTSQTFPFHATTNDFLNRVSKRRANRLANQLEGGNTFDEAHLLRAFEISSQMRHSSIMLQSFTNDLHTFLDSIRQRKNSSGGSADIEEGLGKNIPLFPSGKPSSDSGPGPSNSKQSPRTRVRAVAPRRNSQSSLAGKSKPKRSATMRDSLRSSRQGLSNATSERSRVVSEEKGADLDQRDEAEATSLQDTSHSEKGNQEKKARTKPKLTESKSKRKGSLAPREGRRDSKDSAAKLKNRSSSSSTLRKSSVDSALNSVLDQGAKPSKRQSSSSLASTMKKASSKKPVKGPKEHDGDNDEDEDDLL